MDTEFIHMDLDEGEIVHPLDKMVESFIGKTLATEYPQWSWIVEADHRSGMVIIRCPDLYTMKNRNKGVMVDMARIGTHREMRRAAIMWGGELLERAYVDRETGVRTREEVDNG